MHETRVFDVIFGNVVLFVIIDTVSNLCMQMIDSKQHGVENAVYDVIDLITRGAFFTFLCLLCVAVLALTFGFLFILHRFYTSATTTVQD